jgi:hypothetical protein
MQNHQQNVANLFDPDIRADEELYHLTEKLAGGLPPLHGNVLLLLKTGIPLPTSGLALPRGLREQMTVELYLGAGPGKDFVRHVRPCGTGDVKTDTEPGGPAYRLRVSELALTQKHQVFDRVGR